MAVYTHISHDDIAALLRDAYGLGALHSAQGIAEGVSNSNYLLRFAGDRGEERRAILTLFEGRTDPADIPFFMTLMQHLAAQGVACPQPLPRRDGALSGRVAGRAAALVSFLEGASTPHITPAHTQAAGAALAQLHQAGNGFTGQRSNGLSLAAWQQMAASTLPRLETIEAGLATLVGDELAHLSQHWGQIAALPQGIIHADFFPDNVFFSGTQVRGIIDFYFACRDALLYDVAIALNAWCFTPEHLFSRDRATALLAGYHAVRPLSQAEKSALPLALRGAAMRFLLTRAQDWLTPDTTALVTRKDPREYATKLRFFRDNKEIPIGA